MDWKDQLAQYEKYFGNHTKFDWTPAVLLAQKVIEEYSNDAEAYIRVIYLLHNILVEEYYPESQHNHMAELLIKYFSESKNKFSNNNEYLFFIGKITHIAEWYFGINEESNNIKQTLAFKMQKKAFDNDPENILFEWACRFSLGEKLAGYLAEQILLYDKVKIEWLKSKGFPGTYIIESLKQSRENYRTD